MFIITSYSSGTYKARVISTPDHRTLCTASCTESERGAARAVAAKHSGYVCARNLRQLTSQPDITSLVGDYFDHPQRKRSYGVWTVKPKP